MSAALLEGFRKAERVLLALPNVTGVGFGWKETRGVVTDTPAVRVYVRRKLPRMRLRPTERVPSFAGGWSTDVLPSLDARSSTAEAAAWAKLDPCTTPLGAGDPVSNLRGVLGLDPAGGAGLGTLGFLALTNRTRNPERVLVSNRHVLLAHGASPGDAVYRPCFVRRGATLVIRADLLDRVAEVSDAGLEDNHRFAYASEPAEDYFVDCASARVIASHATRKSMVRAVGRVHPLDVIGHRAPRVSRLGATGGVLLGRVVDVAAPVVSAGRSRWNNLVIRCAPGARIEPGDSGGLVLDEHERAVALLWGRGDTDPSIAYACHIQPVLDRLDVSLLTRGLA